MEGVKCLKKKRMSLAEKWERLTFADDFIFCRVLEKNLDITKEILELLLEIQIDRVELSSAQKDCKTDYLSKGARFDVYVKDGSGRCFDIEIQTSHLTDLAKRARYYQGVMDVDNLMAGEDYKDLKDSYVIFLCLGDPFGLNLPVYTIRNRIDEYPSEVIDDGRLSVFYNAKLYGKMKSQKLQAFFYYLSRQKSDSDLTDRLAALVNRLKISPQERKVYMTLSEMIKENREEGWAEGIEEGLAEGEQRKAIETAKNFLKKHYEPSDIADCTGLPLEQVIALQKEICVTLC